MAQQPRVIPARQGGESPPTHFQITATDTGGAFEWFEMEVSYGDGPIYHSHQRADAVLRVLKGEVKFKLDGVLADLLEGDTCYIPSGTPYTFTNVYPNRPARLLGMYVPAGLQAFLEVWNDLTAQGPPDEITLAELAARYGQVALGPPLAVELNLPDIEA
ncbi:MAG: hypothetical protein Kow0063_11030 [Anaerolineae bacterium]